MIPRRPAIRIHPADVRARCREPPGGRFYIVPSLLSFGDLREGYDSPARRGTEFREAGTLAATIPVVRSGGRLLLSLEIECGEKCVVGSALSSLEGLAGWRVVGRGSVPVDQHSLVPLAQRRSLVLLRVTRRGCPCPKSSSVCHDPSVRPRRLGGPGPFRCSRGGGAAQRGTLQFLRVPREAVMGADLAARKGNGMTVNRRDPPGRLNRRLRGELPSPLLGHLVSVALAFVQVPSPRTVEGKRGGL